MNKLIIILLILINSFIFFQLPLYSSESIDLGDYNTEGNIPQSYAPFFFFLSGDLGIGMPAGDLLETEKDLLKANNEEYDGVNFFHSFNFNLRADSIIHIFEISELNFLIGVRGLFGYYAILHKLNGDSDDYDSDDYTEKDYVKQLLSFGQMLAGPVIYIGGDSGFMGSFHVLYGKIFSGNLTTQPLISEMDNIDTEKSEFKGKKLDMGFGVNKITDKLFLNLNLVISIIDIELENKPVIYNDTIKGSKTSILDLSIGFGFGLRLF